MSRHRRQLTPHEIDVRRDRSGPMEDLDFYERREVKKTRNNHHHNLR